MRRWFLLTMFVTASLAPTSAFAAAPPATGGDDQVTTTTTILNNDFLDTERDISECLNNSIQLPGCGIKSTESGARGGPLQYVTFAMMLLGIAFIFWRVARGVQARDAALAPADEGLAEGSAK